MSSWLSQNLSSDQIIHILARRRCYGTTESGYLSAARSVFSKEFAELNLAETALLAALGINARAGSEFENERLQELRNEVLLKLFQNNVISESQYEIACSETLKATAL